MHIYDLDPTKTRLYSSLPSLESDHSFEGKDNHSLLFSTVPPYMHERLTL